jgi:hypothetical protein
VEQPDEQYVGVVLGTFLCISEHGCDGVKQSVEQHVGIALGTCSYTRRWLGSSQSLAMHEWAGAETVKALQGCRMEKWVAVGGIGPQQLRVPL